MFSTESGTAVDVSFINFSLLIRCWLLVVGCFADQYSSNNDQRPTNNDQIISLTSLTLPVIAAAAAVNGLAKKVRDFGPCLPSKFLLLVLTQYLPAGTLSSFMPRHAEHPGLRNSKPAD